MPTTAVRDYNDWQHPASPVEIEDNDDAVMLVKTTVENCQKLAEWIQRRPVSNSKEVATQSSLLSPNLTSEERLNYQFDEENRLKKVVQEVTDANKRWQKYYFECQKCMQRLVEMVKELRERDPSGTGGSLNNTVNVQQTKNNSEHQHQAAQLLLPEVGIMNGQELKDLQSLNEQLLTEMDTMRSELEQCKRRLSETTYALQRAKQDHKEHTELLEMQSQGHRDDWEAENKERLQLKRKNAQLQSELSAANAKIQELQYHTESCTCYFRNGIHTELNVLSRPRMAYNIPHERHCRLIPRSSAFLGQIVPDNNAAAAAATSTTTSTIKPTTQEAEIGSTNTTTKEQEEGSSSNLQQHHQECSSSPSSPIITLSPSASSPARAAAVVHPPNTFTCPACSKVFTQQKHVQFLEHFETCCRGAECPKDDDDDDGDGDGGDNNRPN